MNILVLNGSPRPSVFNYILPVNLVHFQSFNQSAKQHNIHTLCTSQHNESGLSNRSIKDIATILRSILSHALMLGHIKDRLTLHSLRSSCVSVMVHEGIDIKDIQAWVGHSDISTTMNIYAKTNQKQQQKVMNKISGALFDN